MIEALFKAGAHFAYAKSRRHPSVSPYIFGAKNRVEIFDLEATNEALQKAAAFVKELGRAGKTILFVGGKPESQKAVRAAAERLSQPYVAGRFVGGTITNFPQIRKRVEKLLKLTSERESGELNRYTKKERLLIDRDIDRLSKDFGGIVSMASIPAAAVVIDPRYEKIVVAEAKYAKIPIIALANSDCDLNNIAYAVPGNDALQKSIALFLQIIAAAYEEGKKSTAIAETAIAA